MGRLDGTVAAITGGASFLASAEASYVTGACLFVDGGQTAM